MTMRVQTIFGHLIKVGSGQNWAGPKTTTKKQPSNSNTNSKGFQADGNDIQFKIFSLDSRLLFTRISSTQICQTLSLTTNERTNHNSMHHGLWTQALPAVKILLISPWKLFSTHITLTISTFLSILLQKQQKGFSLSQKDVGKYFFMRNKKKQVAIQSSPTQL